MSDIKSSHKPFSVRNAWKQAKKDLDQMTPAQKIETLVEAGIRTSKGNLTKPYTALAKAK